MKKVILAVLMTVISAATFAQVKKTTGQEVYPLVEETNTGRTDKAGRIVYAKAYENAMITPEHRETITDSLHKVVDTYAHFKFANKKQVCYFPFEMKFKDVDNSLTVMQVDYTIKGNELVIKASIPKYNVPIGITYLIIVEYTKND